MGSSIIQLFSRRRNILLGMRFLYSTIVFIGAIIAYLISFIKPGWRLWFKARDKIQIQKTSKKKLVIHCASHGEYEQVKLLAKEFKNKNYHVILSFFSLSGQEIIKGEQEFFNDIVFLPIDLPSKMNQFLKEVDPSVFIINKYEYWYNLLYQLDNLNIPVVFINVNTHKTSKYFKWPLKSLHKIIRNADTFFVHNENTRLALEEFGITKKNILDSADSRVSSVLYEQEKNLKFPKIEKLGKGIIVYGSIHENEIDAILSGIQALPNYSHILVPHHVDEKNLEKFKNKLPSNLSMFDDPSYQSDLILVDKIGILKHLYKYAKLAYIGGGFGKGLHNCLEAFVEYVPVIGGPKSEGFEELDYFKNEMYYTILEPSQFGKTAKKLLEQDLENLYRDKTQSYFNKRTNLTPILECIDELTAE